MTETMMASYRIIPKISDDWVARAGEMRNPRPTPTGAATEAIEVAMVLCFSGNQWEANFLDMLERDG